MTLKRNLAYNVALSLSQILFPLFTIPYIAHVLDPSGIGRVNFIDSLTYYFIVIADFGIAVYGIREIARVKNHRQQLRQLVSELLSLHIVTSLVSAVLYCTVIAVTYQKIGDPRLLLVAFPFLLANAFACDWYFIGTDQFRYIAIRNILVRLAGLCAIYLLVHRPDDYIVYYGIMCFSAIAIVVWNIKSLFSTLTPRFKNIEWKKHIRFLFIIYQISLVYSVSLFLDNVFLRLLSTPTAVANYAFAMKIMYLSTMLLTNVFYVLYPNSVHLVAEHNEVRLRQTLRASSDMIVLLGVPMAMGVFLIAHDFSMIYFGPDFTAVAGHLRILCLYPLLKGLSLHINKQVMMPFNREKQILKGLVAGMLTFVVLSLPLCYFFEGTGACLAIIFSEAVVLLYNALSARNLLAGHPLIRLRVIGQAAIGSLFFIPIALVLTESALPLFARIAVLLVSCATLYYIILSRLFKNEWIISLASFVTGFFNRRDV